MKTGGLVANTFKIVFGNEDVILSLISFIFIMSLLLVTIEIYKEVRSRM